jgi:hypothetical protein
MYKNCPQNYAKIAATPNQPRSNKLNHKTKLLPFSIVIVLAILACSTAANGGDGTAANILFEDDFSKTNTGWDQETYADGLTDYADGAYKIGIYAESKFFWANPYKNYEDVIVEVEAQKVRGGDDMQYGVICRHQDVENWYTLAVTADGFAVIRKRFNGGDLDFITDWAEAPSILTGNNTNLLRAECVGDRLSLYVNGELVIETLDSDIAKGDVGLMAGTFEQPDAEILFDNFIVRKP